MSALPQATVAFRPMSAADIDAIMEVELAAYEFPWTPAIFRDCLRVGYCCWVLSHSNEIDGYGIMTVGAGECHILNLCIRPQLQNLGLGRALMEHLLELAVEHQADTAFLEVRPSNPVAIKLYDNLGFNQVGLRRRYYPAEYGREDALILAKSIRAHDC
ncbi:MAG: ribosomal protein S18-alanine N-acetyltransferase [Gammaproteobacteria bacterium]